MFRRVLLVLALLAGPAVVLAASAQAAGGARGKLVSAVQNTSTHRVTVQGLAYDPAHSSASIVVNLYADGTFVRRVQTTGYRPTFNKTRHISGKHGFTISFTWKPRVRIISLGTAAGGHRYVMATRSAGHVASTTADRIIAVAKQYVGKARYRDGGASPSQGFDCSGYTKYVFAAAKVGTLPHNADGQRRMSRMHRVLATSARAGDLVFYQGGGGYSFHVAIYAGHHMQYAAATVRDGIRYQPIWSSNVVYGRYV